MAESSVGAPVFAGRYKFQTVGNDWDTGRSGFTHLVFDTKKERLGVIKRAEINSQHAVDGLRNEVAALLDLKGPNVPELYDTGEAEHGSKTYFYVVMEYIDGLRIEKNLVGLTALERAKITTQFFDILAKAHNQGIVNGDVDLKHLFWRTDKQQLVMIDWGNAKHDVDPKKKSEFAFDLARAAEIIHVLVTRKGRPAIDNVTLPKDTALFEGLSHLPREFRTLCKWAPRNPATNAQAPHTAQELLEASKEWQKGVPYRSAPKLGWVWALLLGIVLVGVGAWVVFQNPGLMDTIFPKTATPTASSVPPTDTATIGITDTSSPQVTITEVSTFTPTPSLTSTTTPSPTLTFTPVVTPSPRPYNVIFDTSNRTQLPQNSSCWVNETNLPSMNFLEGFSSRNDGNWQFRIDPNRSTDQFIRADLSPCLEDVSQVQAVAVNTWITRLELQRTLTDTGTVEDGKQFGLFVEGEAGSREYTIWMDINQTLNLRVRDGNGNTLLDQQVRVISEDHLKIQGAFPRLNATFSIQIFLEINNQGLDILYLKQAEQNLVRVGDLSPTNQMIIIDQATFPSIGTIKKVGLVGYGGETTSLIWPLAFFGE